MKDFYDLCWDCYMKNEDYYLDLWYQNIAGHSIGCFKCEICGKSEDTLHGWEPDQGVSKENQRKNL